MAWAKEETSHVTGSCRQAQASGRRLRESEFITNSKRVGEARKDEERRGKGGSIFSARAAGTFPCLWSSSRALQESYARKR